MTQPTLFARASGSGRAGVAVFRISGPLAAHAVRTLTGGLGKPRYARRVEVRDTDGSFVDDGLSLWFPAPHSFTGDDVVELQLHGSPAVTQRLASALEELGLEPAGPGAFTMQAFANGKLDLTQAEGLAELLEAETKRPHEQAIGNYRGALRDRADNWRRDLIAAMAVLDAAVDFPDEEGVPEDVAQRARPAVDAVQASLTTTLEQAAGARRLAEGLKVVIIGPPNAGKSSLFNALLRSERAIVSDEAGTTRDFISARLEWDGYLVELTDTAGLREDATSPVEQAGIDRAEGLAAEADLLVICWPSGEGELPDWLERWRGPQSIVVRTKADQIAQLSAQDLSLSVITDVGLDELRALAASRFAELAAPGMAPTQRQAALLSEALSSLCEFDRFALVAPEAAAECLRAASRSLEVLTGRIAPDDILDDIFSSFCIGK